MRLRRCSVTAMAAAAELVTVYMGNPGEGLVFAPDGSGWARYTTGSGSYREPNWLIRFAKSTDAAPLRSARSASVSYRGTVRRPSETCPSAG